MSKGIRLRCQFGSGERKPLNGLTETSTLVELQALIFSVTDIDPVNQRIKSGFPPKPLRISVRENSLKDCGIRSGDTLIVEESKDPSINASTTTNGVNKILNTNGVNQALKSVTVAKIVRKVVPADNSCLFASVSFVVLSDTSFADDLRILAANRIAGDQETYNEVFLGKPNIEYCEWLTKKEHWGGAIELNVFSQYYKMEINVADVQSGRIDRYGESEHYTNRVFLLYDGIHYDPLALQDNGTIVQTVFSTSESRFQIEVLELAEQLKIQRQYTDVAGFALRCLVCNTPLKGQRQAQEHAKKTGHMNFGEV